MYWQGDATDTADTITISLPHAATVTGLLLQRDNGDSYAVSHEALDGTWHALPDAFSPHGTVADPSAGTVGWGMGTSALSFAAITAQAFRIDASGDQSYAVSEFQATGQFLPTVPEPASGLLVLAGLGHSARWRAAAPCAAASSCGAAGIRREAGAGRFHCGAGRPPPFDNPRLRILDEDRPMQFESLVSLLEAGGARFRVIEHPAEGRSDLVAQIRGTAPGQGAKAMLCRSKDGDPAYGLVVLPGDRKLDFKRVAQALGLKKATLASPDEAMAATGCAIGAIPPFVDGPALRLVVDPALVERFAEIAFNAGRLDRSIVLDSADYVRIARPTLLTVSA